MKTVMRGVSIWLMLLWIFYPLRGYETEAFSFGQALARFIVLGLVFGLSAWVTYMLPEKKRRKKNESIIRTGKNCNRTVSGF